MIEPMKAKQSLKAAELQDGDIVCFQKADAKSSESDRESVTHLTNQLTLADNDDRSVSSPKSSLLSKTSSNSSEKPPSSKSSVALDRIDNAQQFYDFLAHRREVKFHPHPTRNANPEQWQPFELILSNKHSYDQIAAKVGEHLNVDPTHLRFWTVNAANGNPKASVKRGQSQTLNTILNPPYSTFSNANQRPDALYFEVLDISLTELDTKKALRVVWLSEGMSKEVSCKVLDFVDLLTHRVQEPFDILVPKNGTVEDLIAALIKKAQLEDEEKAGPIRVYETHSSKIHKILSRESSVLGITEYVHVIAERIPEEDLEPDTELIQAFHFQNEPSKSHGIPFRFKVIAGEVFSDTKKRLEKRTGIKGKNFEKIKFAIVKRSSYSKPTYLTDGK
jgi:ubiquitin carboxyl-terminal hydrolase 7